MKIITPKGIYIQKKDLELIFLTTDKEEIPSNIINTFRKKINIKEENFIFFRNTEEVSFLDKFWFIVNFFDIMNYNESDSMDNYFQDLQSLRKTRIDYDKFNFSSGKKIFNSYINLIVDEMRYFNYIPTKNEAKKYPINFQLLYNKVSDIMLLNHFKGGNSDLKLPKGIYDCVHYTKKELEQIYSEVLNKDLSFYELEPYSKQLYRIFSRIDFSRDIGKVINKLILFNKFHSTDFVKTDLLNILTYIANKRKKQKPSPNFLMDFLYVAQFDKFNNNEAKIALEKDIRTIKRVINYLLNSKPSDKYLEQLSTHNCNLAKIIKATKSCEYLSAGSKTTRDIFLNMLAFVFLNPTTIHFDYNFLNKVYKYLTTNELLLLNHMDYNLDKAKVCDDVLAENFNKSNSLLLFLYNKKYTKALEQCVVKSA